MGAISSFGTQLKIGDGQGTEAFTTIAEVMDISGPSLSQGTQEVTPQTAPNRARVFIATLLDGGEVSFDINYEPAGATHDQTTGLIKDMTDGTLRNFQTVFPDAATTTWSFAAFITGFEPSAPVDGALTASVTFKISGLPTIA
jgi:hypothetical protein